MPGPKAPRIGEFECSSIRTRVWPTAEVRWASRFSQSVRRFVGGMASKKISLLPLKVTRRPTYGKKSVKYYERSVGYDSVREQVECEPSSDSTRVPVEDYMQANTSALNEPTCYEVETKA